MKTLLSLFIFIYTTHIAFSQTDSKTESVFGKNIKLYAGIHRWQNPKIYDGLPKNYPPVVGLSFNTPINKSKEFYFLIDASVANFIKDKPTYTKATQYNLNLGIARYLLYNQNLFSVEVGIKFSAYPVDKSIFFATTPLDGFFGALSYTYIIGQSLGITADGRYHFSLITPHSLLFAIGIKKFW